MKKNVCANCGRRIFKMQPTLYNGRVMPGATEYWTHIIDGGGETDCHLSATPREGIVLKLAEVERELLLHALGGIRRTPFAEQLYERIHNGG